MKALYDVPAPAKLNLFLHLTGRRPDGYHLLQSVFMLIDWCDTLHFEWRPHGQLSRQDLTVPLPEQDLVLRAARLLQSSTGCTQGAHIAIDKQIPAQAGMGGGSSDAASCLLALNRLWGLDLPRRTLAALALQLGADVPFFLHGRNAWVEGIGERITPIDVAPAHFAVVKVPDGLDTGKIFSSPLLKRDSGPAIISVFAANPYGFGQNDLQPVAEALCPEMLQALQWLRHQGLAPRMTGSGSAVFAQVPQDFEVASAMTGWQVRVCGNLMAHPLEGWAVSDNMSVGSF